MTAESDNGMFGKRSAFQILEGDCVEAMRELDEASVDAIVTDPPYSLGFMGKAWDTDFDHAWTPEALRVLKPGGHLLAFGGTRTYHRLACAIEDAGFEIRDSLIWLYGSGFPKSLDVSKAIDRAAGAEREVIGEAPLHSNVHSFADPEAYTATDFKQPITAPATPEAEKWDGWGTALKPGHEPIVMARKPLVGTVAANVQQHGTGALNIDGCRIGLVDGLDDSQLRAMNRSERENDGWGMNTNGSDEPRVVKPEGRWPANVILSPEAAEELDRQSGDRGNHGGVGEYESRSGFGGGIVTSAPDDQGGASRFYYCAKASRGERNAGLDGFDAKRSGVMQDDAYKWERDGKGNEIDLDTRSANHHPTVKPIPLMRWLCRLVTPLGGTILDPFLGSGTTGCAVALEDFDFIGIEREAEYVEIAKARIAYWRAQPKQLELAA